MDADKPTYPTQHQKVTASRVAGQTSSEWCGQGFLGFGWRLELIG
jgi:hypothetical protein